MIIYIFTHTDIDGVGSAALALRAVKKIYREDVDLKLAFVEPVSLPKTLKNTLEPITMEKKLIIITDIGANTGTIDDALNTLSKLKGEKEVIWIDHHVWEDEWREKALKHGVKLYIDTSTCAAGLAYRVFKDYLEDEHAYLASNVCSADLWLWNEWFSTLLYRVIGRYTGSRGDAWKRYLVQEFSEKRIWSDELQDVLENYVNLELKGYVNAEKEAYIENIDNTRIVYYIKKPGPPNNSLIASYLLSKHNAQVAVVIRQDASISLRSRGTNVRRIALCLGGGGHPKASGASISLPIHYKIMKYLPQKIYEKLLLKKTRNSVKNCIQKSIDNQRA